MSAAVRIKSHTGADGFVAFVSLPGEPEVRVRFRRSDTRPQWTCDHCGAHRFSTCPHETAARTAWTTQPKDLR